ncbi:FprA family A-type flavoprotein [Candidatus Cryosericum septentrionale]|jgi:flavorubredoxin|uniref:FprA family A-type flavoprotein n=2 Tax=Candidatus Cryosericum septentrionale TaxID=2290913 RepID=A0A398DWR5_9BACT|nr:FprA family A-type flavoprotein [Candidatus Cryosericum septentrionale]
MPGITLMGAVDWDRRLFDSLIPLPEGTSYNAYLVRGSEKTALVDTVDPAKVDVLMAQLDTVQRLDYLVAQHAEQDHSGSIPAVLARYPGAVLVTNPKAKELLQEHLDIPDDRFKTVADGETLSLGNKTLRFIYLPWVHWPETMGTYIEEDHVLFSCDFLGSHRAQSGVFAERHIVMHGAKRYYAEIMMPFRSFVIKNLDKLAGMQIDMVCPSHGPIYKDPTFIMDAYREWAGDPPHNKVVIPFISMHGSTLKMVDRLTAALADRGVTVERFDLTTSDLGEIAMSLVDAATIVIGTPAVLTGPHPKTIEIAYLAGALRPKTQFVSIVGSFGWGQRIVDILGGLIAPLKAELLTPVLAKGEPRAADMQAIDVLADTIAARHREAGLH